MAKENKQPDQGKCSQRNKENKQKITKLTQKYYPIKDLPQNFSTIL